MARNPNILPLTEYAAMMERYPELILQGYELGREMKLEGKYRTIIISGMGGSGSSGKLLHSYLHSEISIQINGDWHLPGHNMEDTFTIAVSYSGNTEETLGCYRDAVRRKIPSLGIASGGKLEELCIKDGNPLITVPKGYPPRIATPMMMTAQIGVLENMGLIPSQEDYIKKAAEEIQRLEIREKAEQVSGKVKSKLLDISASPDNLGILQRWMGSFSENSMNRVSPLTLDYYSESPGLLNPFFGRDKDILYLLLIGDSTEDKYYLDLMEEIKSVLNEEKEHCDIVTLQSGCRLSSVLSLMAVGDWLSYYLALKQGMKNTFFSTIKFKDEYMRGIVDDDTLFNEQ